MEEWHQIGMYFYKNVYIPGYNNKVVIINVGGKKTK